jgi:glycosyltransferase involved in cell wall biosynthesis
MTPQPRRKKHHVIGGLDYGGTARQLTVLAANLPTDHFQQQVACLRPDAPWAESLRKAGVPVDALGLRRPFDLRPFLALRSRARNFRPDVVHAWGPLALRSVALVPGTQAGGRLVVSEALGSGHPPRWPGRFLLRRAARVVALGEAEARRYQAAGVRPERITRAMPAAPPLAPTGPSEPALAVPANGRVILGIGPLDMGKGFRDAAWTLDILRQVYEDLHLVLVGVGPDRPRIEHFARAIGAGGSVHFTGAVADLGPLLARAELVWVPSLADRGRGAALEAMAAGRPVVASRWPGLAEVVADGVTGLLVAPGDKAALARQTRVLLEDAGLRRRMGEAARQRAREAFAPEGLVRACSDAYGG